MKNVGAVVFAGVLSIFLLGSFVRLYGLEKYYFWADEAVILLLSKSLSFNVLNHLRQEPHPPLYYFFVKLIMLVFGVNKPLLLRSVSLLSGVLTILVGYFFGLRLAGKKSVGLAISFLLATSPLCIEQSQVVRGYSLFLLWLLLLHSILLREPFRKTDFYLSCTFMLLATMTHFSLVVLFPALFVVGMFKVRQIDRGAWRYQVIWVLVFALCGGLVLIGKLVAPQNLLTGHISGLHAVFREGPWATTQETIKIWTGFFGAPMRGLPILAILSMVVGSCLMAFNKKWSHLILFLGAYASSALLAQAGVYPLVAGRHSIVLLVPTLLPVLWTFWFLAKKEQNILGIVILVLLFFQLRAPKNIFKPDDNRWSLGEGSPKLENLQAVSDAIKLGVFKERPILMDWGKYVCVLLERSLKPSWAMLSTETQAFESCSWGAFSSEEGMCNCIRGPVHVPGKAHALLMTAGAWEMDQAKLLAESGKCGIREIKTEIPGELSLVSFD
jgi:hypothetical protein